MKKTPKIITRFVRSRAYVAGRTAFEQNMRRVYNPYRNIHIELASSWWQGWDAAEEESHTDQQNSMDTGETPASILDTLREVAKPQGDSPNPATAGIAAKNNSTES